MLELLGLRWYSALAHTVITDMKDASNGLRWCVGEMERRYKLMSAMARNSAGFNRKVDDANKAGTPIADPLFKPEENFEPGAAVATAPNLEALPCIVVVIDEFADMMMIVDKKKVEQLISRIAQKARAAGIHLISQPSALGGCYYWFDQSQRAHENRVSGFIQNRLAYHSRRTGGAEQLLGHGDMLYLPSGTSYPFVFTVHLWMTTKFTAWLQIGKNAYTTIYRWHYRRQQQLHSRTGIPSEGGEEDNGESDALDDEAVAFVLESRKRSFHPYEQSFASVTTAPRVNRNHGSGRCGFLGGA